MFLDPPARDQLPVPTKAACSGAESSLFFPDHPDDPGTEGIRLCLSCPLIAPCAQAGLGLGGPYLADEGVWGALNPQARKRIHIGMSSIELEWQRSRELVEHAAKLGPPGGLPRPTSDSDEAWQRLRGVAVELARAAGVTVAHLLASSDDERARDARHLLFVLLDGTGWSPRAIAGPLQRPPAEIIAELRAAKRRFARGDGALLGLLGEMAASRGSKAA
jgi:hypothetical protein